MEKNRKVDQIKDLKYELGRWQKKAADQQKHIDALHEAIKEARAGMDEINQVVDSIMAEIARTYGTKTDAGIWELRLPLVSVRRNNRDYEVEASVAEDNDAYIIRVARRKTEDADER